MTTTVDTRKDLASAYLFGTLLGLVYAHQFYLGNVRTAVIQNVVWWGGWALIFARAAGVPMVWVLGVIAIVGGFVWWVIDLCLMPSYVRAANAGVGS